MVFDRTKVYVYEDVESSIIETNELVISDALNIISFGRDVERYKVAQWVLDTYGGSLENAIIMAFINIDWGKLDKMGF